MSSLSIVRVVVVLRFGFVQFTPKDVEVVPELENTRLATRFSCRQLKTRTKTLPPRRLSCRCF